MPAFKPPESRNAARTLLILGLILGTPFVGITFLSKASGVDPVLIERGETVTSQIARTVFGGTSFMFYAVQAFTALILFLAANTAYADFPRLASILAKDRYLPRGLSQRGDRLAFSNGILILTFAAAGILINYGANVHRIVPLYVVGVFTSFTLSQAGMAVRTLRGWQRARALGRRVDRDWKLRVLISGFGALTTGVVLAIVGTTKFFSPLQPGQAPGFRGGAWQIIILIPSVAFMLSRIRRHNGRVTEELKLSGDLPQIRSDEVVLVVSTFRGTTKALALARAMAPRELRAVAFRCTHQRLLDLRNRWDSMGVSTPIEPLGGRVADVLKFIRSMNPTSENPVTLIVPDPHYETWFGQVLHNRKLLQLKRAFSTKAGPS